VNSKYDNAWGGWCSNEVHGVWGGALEEYEEGLEDSSYGVGL
jgi:hypothetical protein